MPSMTNIIRALIKHNDVLRNSTTDSASTVLNETAEIVALARKMDESIRSRVVECLNNAKEGGYLKDVTSMTALEVASDLIDCTDQFSRLEPEDIEPYVKEWRRGKG